MHADLDFKLVRIIYTLREKKNVCKHVCKQLYLFKVKITLFVILW